jgi:hypothetical protein
MNARVRKGLAVAALHVAIVASVGGKLLIDRETRPRAWARTAPVDPSRPIRGRYVRLRVEAVPSHGLVLPAPPGSTTIAVAEEGGQLVALRSTSSNALHAHVIERDGQRVLVIDQPVAYFIPENIADPSIRRAGEELWVEVTLPRGGPPRPIRLGVRKAGVLTPLELD